MEIAVIGVNHQKAPIEIREKVSFTESKKNHMSNELKDKGISEVVIISTCNRSEVYIVSEYIDFGISAVIHYLEEMSICDKLEDYLIVKKERDAISHLYRVACGLDSLVIGEDQILGQVKEGHSYAMEHSYSNKYLNKLFREAITKAKWVKNKYRISENPTSISYVGLKLLKSKIDSLSDKRVLIIGAGNMGKLSLTYIMNEVVEKIYITNRTHNKLNELISSYSGVAPIKYEERYEVLKNVDVLISTTASPHVIFKKEKMPRIEHSLIILDLALPRDVDKEINNIDNVDLYDIDDLKDIIEKNVEYRKSLIEPIMESIEDGVNNFCQWKCKTKLDPIMEQMERHCLAIEKETLSTIFDKVNLLEKDKVLIEKMVASALKRTIKQPLVNLRNIHDDDKLDEYIMVANEIFRM